MNGHVPILLLNNTLSQYPLLLVCSPTSQSDPLCPALESASSRDPEDVRLLVGGSGRAAASTHFVLPLSMVRFPLSVFFPGYIQLSSLSVWVPGPGKQQVGFLLSTGSGCFNSVCLRRGKTGTCVSVQAVTAELHPDEAGRTLIQNACVYGRPRHDL